MSEKKKFPFVKILLGTALLFVLLLALGVFLLLDVINPYNDLSFDPVVWKAGQNQQMAMAEDLVRNHISVGMHESEVAQTLGHAGDVHTDYSPGGLNLPGEYSWSYYIGNDSLGKGDDVFVYVHFDPESRVLGSEIHGY